MIRSQLHEEFLNMFKHLFTQLGKTSDEQKPLIEPLKAVKHDVPVVFECSQDKLVLLLVVGVKLLGREGIGVVDPELGNLY